MEKGDKDNLNTIYEEFDLGDRSKKLKGKRIKVKRLVKKENGDYTLRDSTTFLNETNEQINEQNQINPQFDVISQATVNVNFSKKRNDIHNNRIIIENEIKQTRQSTTNMKEKSPVNVHNNPLYYSTNNNSNFHLSGNFAQTHTITNSNVYNQPKDSYINENIQNREAILRNIDRAPDRRNNNVYTSQVVGKKEGNLNLINNNIFKLPANVNSFLEKENIIKDKIQTKTNIERKKAFDKIDELRDQMNFVFDDAKSRVSARYEEFLNDFYININNFRSLCVKYKNIDSWIKEPTSENKGIKLKSIQYFNVEDNSVLKTEKTEILVDSFDVQKVMNRKLLSYIAESLEKRILHIPKFASTSSTTEFLEEMKKNICASVQEELQNVEDLLYSVNHISVDKVRVQYEHEISNTTPQPTHVSESFKNSFKIGKNSVTGVLVERDFVEMRKSMANLNQVYNSIQMKQNLNRFAHKNDFDFSFKNFDLGNQFEGKDFNGITLVDDFYLVYGNEFYYQLNLTQGKIRAFEFKERNLLFITLIKSKLSCLRLEKTAFLDKDQTTKDFILIATTNNSTNQSEIILGEMKEGILNIYKRIKLETNSKIKKILSLKDLYTFITITEDGMIYLCDLGMKGPKEIIDKCKNQIVLSCDILENQEYFTISQANKLVSIFEVIYEKSNYNEVPVAKKLERVRILNNNYIINQIKSTGILLFEGVDSNGQFISVDIGKGDVKNTKINAIPVIQGNIDRFFLLNNKILGKNLKKKVIFYMNFNGEVGLYNYENQHAHSFRLDNIKGEFSESEQNMILNKFQNEGVEVFVVSKKELLKIYFK